MCGKLAQSGQSHFLHNRRDRLAFFIWSKQSLGNEKILPHSQRSQQNMPFDNLAGTRIPHATAVRPATGRPVYPVYNVVTNVHWVCVFGQNFYLKGIFVSGSLKGLVPPFGAVDKRGANRLRCCGIDIVNDRLNCLADCSFRVLFLQAMAGNIAFEQRLGNWSGVVLITNSTKTGPRIMSARLVTIIRQLNK